ncbi:MAG: hypothetical protein WC756_17645 [Taibaiella sp.]|jgi:uncharacterized membrane protein HdeD (DUF308 family)
MKQILTPLVETIIRLASKSPKYFRLLQLVIAIATALCGVLTYIHDKALLALPDWTLVFTGADSIIAGIIALFVAMLPAKSTDAVKAKVDATLNK